MGRIGSLGRLDFRVLVVPLRLLVLLFLLGLPWGACQAESLRFCDPQVTISAAQQDRLFRFGGLIKDELEASGQSVALIARSGLDLSRFGDIRYSHAGLSLKDSRNTAWSVRQLYYACDERMPKIFDQGMSGFVLGTDDPSIGYVSLVLLPAGPGASLAQAALDDRRAVTLLAGAYSANAYPFSTLYQNCNQWVMEVLATAWGRLGDGLTPMPTGEPTEMRTEMRMPMPTQPSAAPGDDLRRRAQRWLRDDGYRPLVFDIANPALMLIGSMVPWLHFDDHPPGQVVDRQLRVSMPLSIDAYVRAAVPEATRIEFCHTDRYAVIHRGWEPIADGCVPGPQDTVIALE